jgi:type II secretory pathway predicted ATPase ExeA
MYHTHFGLDYAPFGITPNTQLFFSGAQRGDVLDALIYAVTHGEGIVKVVGEVGSGKTMLCRMLQARLPDHIDVVFLSNPRIDPADVLHAIAREMKLRVAKDASRLDVQSALERALLRKHAKGGRVVVFVEEAQGAPLDTLEEIRLLTNLETEREKLLQIVLFGQPELETHLADPRIRQLRERITHSFTLTPLPADLVAEYVRHRLRKVGHATGELFTAPALHLLADTSQGLMRRINILADKSLLAAFAAGAAAVEVDHVRAALRDSEFQPGPVTGAAPASSPVAPAVPKVRVALALGLLLILLALVALAFTAAGEAAVVAPETAAKRLTTQVFRSNADAMTDLERFLRARARPRQLLRHQPPIRRVPENARR